MLSYKILAGLSSAGLVASVTAPIDPMTQLIGGGVCAVLLGWVLIRTIPHLHEQHRQAVENLAAAHTASVDKLVDCHDRNCDKLAGEAKASNDRLCNLLERTLEKETRGIT